MARKHLCRAMGRGRFPTSISAPSHCWPRLPPLPDAADLSNAPISNYTRDQGWGMGHHVGAIPSVIGGHNIELSHVGMVFESTHEVLPRWRRWYKHVLRDQLVVWMPACFLGMALPSMLSCSSCAAGPR